MATSSAHYALPTRSSSEDPIFGTYLAQLPQNRLPLMTEIYRNFLYRKESEVSKLFQRGGKLIKTLDSDTKTKLYREITLDLKKVWWTEASIPVKEDKNIQEDVKNLIEKGSKFGKDISQVKSIGRDEFFKRKGFDKILDISKCR